MGEIRSSTEIKDPRKDIVEYFPEVKYDSSNIIANNENLKTEYEKRDNDFETRESPSKKDKLNCVEEAFELIRNSLDDHEKRGYYMFHVMRCRL
jgi:predicted nuclease with TOPRIM domain